MIPPTLLAAAQTDDLVRALVIVVLVALGCIGVGTTAMLLRVILPGVARAADGALRGMGGRRLFLAGILPLVGAGLLARGVGLTQNEVLGGAYVLVVALPLTLAWITGALAGLPHIGARLLRGGTDASPLMQGAVGGLVTGLSMVTWALPPLGVLVTVILTGWFVGIGLGSAFRARAKNHALDPNQA